MKFFLLASLVIAAVVAEPEAQPEAEAKPQYYSTLGYSGYSPYSTYSSYTPYTTYSSPYYGYSHYIGKREAESDPQYFGYGYGSYSPYAYGAYSPYTTYSSPYYSYGTRYIGKREAESKPELVYTDGTFHTNVANLQKGVNNQYVKPYGAVYNSVPAPYAPATVAYAAAPVAVQTPLGYSRIYKREAESEPQYFGYGSYSPYTYGYSSYGSYSPYTYGYNYGYRPYVG